ncbi:MAG: response regulator transcription factor [Solirubrobacterales bacterium]|nr:response regulator transcription factor [Solirubrobacterales bacterium]
MSPGPARVLLIASDRRFRALASALLSQRGHAVSVSRAGIRVDESAAGEVDVVVIDASASLSLAAREVARLRARHPAVGIVAVSDDAAEGLSALPVIAKWGSFTSLMAAVDRAAGQPRRVPAAR